MHLERKDSNSKSNERLFFFIAQMIINYRFIKKKKKKKRETIVQLIKNSSNKENLSKSFLEGGNRIYLAHSPGQCRDSVTRYREGHSSVDSSSSNFKFPLLSKTFETFFSDRPVFRVRLEHPWRWNKGERYTGGVVRHHSRHGERDRKRNRKWSIKRAKQAGLRHPLYGIATAHLRRGHLENMAGKGFIINLLRDRFRKK